MIIAINYADEKFEVLRKYNTETAYSIGKVDKVIEYSPEDIDSSFRRENNIIFSYTRGAGLWLWKPYVILKALRELNDGDYLFYTDAGSFYCDKVQYLVETLENSHQSILGFGLPLLERQFTKKETFKLMEYSDYQQNQMLASYIFLKKTAESVAFVEEWLKYATDERILSPRHFCPEITEFDDFVAHREDQSIFSILYRKNGYEVFRDPSEFGDRPWLYAWVKRYEQMKDVFPEKWNYRPSVYKNSAYPQILVSCRNVNINPKKLVKINRRNKIIWKIKVLHKLYFQIRFGAYMR